MALSVPLSRPTLRVGGGSAFFVRPLVPDSYRLTASKLPSFAGSVSASHRIAIFASALQKSVVIRVHRWFIGQKYEFRFRTTKRTRERPNKSPEPTAVTPGSFRFGFLVVGCHRSAVAQLFSLGTKRAPIVWRWI
jgi:hypothetical protein